MHAVAKRLNEKRPAGPEDRLSLSVFMTDPG